MEKNKKFWESLDRNKRVEEDEEEDLDVVVDPDLAEGLGSDNLG